MRKFFQSEPINVIFKADQGLMARVDEYARVTQTSRSWVIRASLEAFFEQLPAPEPRQQQEARF